MSGGGSHAAIEINSSEQLTAIFETAGSLPVFMDFTATWCPPCQMIKPIYEQIAQANQGKGYFVKVDVDDQSSIAEQFGIECMPTFIVYKQGKVVEKMEGADKNGLQALVARHTAK